MRGGRGGGIGSLGPVCYSDSDSDSNSNFVTTLGGKQGAGSTVRMRNAAKVTGRQPKKKG